MKLTQTQLDVLNLPIRNKRIKIELLDSDDRIIDTLEGVAIGGSIINNAESTIRRSGNIELCIDIDASATTFLDAVDNVIVGANGKIWLDKNIRIFVGIEDITQPDSKVIWYKLGVFLIDQPVHSIGASTYSINFNCIDKMARLTGDRQGQLTGSSIQIPATTTKELETYTTKGYVPGEVQGLNPMGESCTFKPNGEQIVFVLQSNNIAIFNIEENNLTKIENPVTVPTDQIVDVCFKPDSSQLVLATSDKFYIYDSTTTPYTYLTEVGATNLTSCTFNSDGSKFIYSQGNADYSTDALRVYNTNVVPYTEYNRFYGGELVQKVACSANGDYVFSMGQYCDTNTPLYLGWGMQVLNSNFGPITETSFDISFWEKLNGVQMIDFCVSPDSTKLTIIINQFPYVYTFDITTTPFTLLETPEKLPPKTPLKCSYYPNGKYLAILQEETLSLDNNIMLYDTSTNPYTLVDSPFANLDFTAVYSNAPKLSIFVNDFCFYNDTLALAGMGSYRISHEGGTTSSYRQYGFLFNINNIIERQVPTKTFDALYSFVKEIAQIDKFTISDIPEEYKYLPYDIKLATGATIQDGLKQFNDILSTWQFYYDIDGIFRIEPIPSGENDIVYPLLFDKYVSNDIAYNFSNIKNQIVVYGKINKGDFFADFEAGQVKYFGNTLRLYFEEFDTTKLVEKATNICFSSPNEYNPTVSNVEIYSNNQLVLSGALYGFEGSSEEISENMIQPNEIYVIRIFSAKTNNEGYVDISSQITFELYSRQQPSACLVDDNIESPFYINTNLPQPNYYAGTAYVDTGFNVGENYKLTLNNRETLSELEDKTIITFMANAENRHIQDSGFSSVSIYAKNSETALLQNIPLVENYWTNKTTGVTRNYVQENKLSNDYTIYMIQYDKTNNWFVFLGRNNKALSLVLSGGEYDNIHADQLAYERCLWELYQHSNLQNQIVINCVPDYLLDTHIKIPYDTNANKPLSFRSDTPDYEYYLTKSVTYPLGVGNNTQTIQAIKIYDSGNLLSEQKEGLWKTN